MIEDGQESGMEWCKKDASKTTERQDEGSRKLMSPQLQGTIHAQVYMHGLSIPGVTGGRVVFICTQY